MASIYKSADLSITPEQAWDFVDKFTRSEVHVFSGASAERQEGDYRVVTDLEGNEVWELGVAVDPEHRRATYTVPNLFGATFHAASMQIFEKDGPGCKLVWITDVLPNSFADEYGEFYVGLFDDLVNAIEKSVL
ncbi:SRPBCC family protein [Nocardia sp. 348MFTsu5.1]|uniref:SRPBCC family protein n=1 Tax=Nocardia sp. 348MFTsu5.1 TaxID=1172185 RepID=UPI000377688A|nr:SRPBCC family protein [Nocardia sp. 348MFTsu5.1]